jgi:hypothetical protein
MDNFYFNFKLGEYNFLVIQNEDEKPKLTINNKDFNDILKDERTGKLDRDKQNYLKASKNEPKRNNNSSESEYYKRALKYNGENYVEGNDGEIYDIEEQRRRLEEFERKKQKENEEKKKKNKSNIYHDDNNKNSNIDKNKEKKYLNFVLDNETVRKNQNIIQNINNIFDDDNLLDLNDIDFNQIANNLNGNLKQNNLFDNNNNNNNYDFGQMNKDINNGNNQNVINQFLSNMENNNNFNFDNGFNNNDNNNYNNQNIININQIQNQNNNNNYNDDFNPFDD